MKKLVTTIICLITTFSFTVQYVNATPAIVPIMPSRRTAVQLPDYRNKVFTVKLERPDETVTIKLTGDQYKKLYEQAKQLVLK